MRRLLPLLLVVACANPRLPAASAPTPALRYVAPLERDHPLVGRIWDVQRQRFSDEATLLADLSDSAVVALGEQHDNPDHHLLQARVMQALSERGRGLSLVVEMLDRQRQTTIDATLAHTPNDADALGRAIDWEHSGWPAWALYRPIFERALQLHALLFAAGLDRSFAMRLGSQGSHALPPELVGRFGLEQPLATNLLGPLRDELREAHCGLLPDSMLDPMVLVQRARDAELAARVLDAPPDRLRIVIAGNGHVRSDRGVPALLRHASKLRVRTLGLLEVHHGWTQPHDYAAESGGTGLAFDYVWFTPVASAADHCAELREQLRRDKP